ncbi:hypothetical protein P692DRAFT_20827797 [Suillus brevipes Sb2]|nr:hypothetical protein P692DRAFT_20827797 [Suillus brevipes Sb2]
MPIQSLFLKSPGPDTLDTWPQEISSIVQTPQSESVECYKPSWYRAIMTSRSRIASFDDSLH